MRGPLPTSTGKPYKRERRLESSKPPATAVPAMPTFREAAAIVLKMNAATWENARTESNWQHRAELYVFPVIGDTPIDQIGRVEVLGILTPIWTEKPETARRVRMIIKTVMAWASAFGYTSVNPAGEVINAALPKNQHRRHFRALPYAEVADALAAVEASTAFTSTKLAFRFGVLTAARSIEVREATWDEIGLENAVWTIPASRMKMRREHRVPMSAKALAVLKAAQDMPTGDSPYIFPNDLTPENPLSANAFSRMLKKLSVEAVPHGFRSSFRDWAAENTDASYAVMELALAHDVGNAVIQSYARSDLLERRRKLMEDWAMYITG